MASIQKTANGRYRARYRDGSGKDISSGSP